MTQPTPTPALYGFTVEWDDLNKVWVAVSAHGKYRFVGRNQSELEGRRNALYGQILAEFAAAITEVWPRRDT